MNLKDKVAVVTGASDGIGCETAIKLAGVGVSLALVARNEEKLKEVLKECQAAGSPKAAYYPCDLTSNAEVEAAVQKICSELGKVNILLNIAGVWQKLNFLEDISKEEVDNVIKVNLIAPIQLTRLLLPVLKEQDEAAIINFVSRSGVTAQPGQTMYCASKWGMYGFTEVLKEDLKQTKVRVAGLYPAGIKTGLLDKAGDKIDTSLYSDPKDIADTIVFMLTRPASLWLHDVRITY